MSTDTLKRTQDKGTIVLEAAQNLDAVIVELNRRSLYHFLQHFWDVVSPHSFQHNWHIEYLCSELEKIAYRVAEKKPKEYDLIINIPPGSTKTITCSIMFPVWCWTNWHWLRFICASYSSALSMETAEYCRDLIRSPEFKRLYPNLGIKEDKDTKSNFKLVKYEQITEGRTKPVIGGSRYSTSVGGTLTGFHGDILIVDDPLNPNQAVSEVELASANRWCEQTLSTRKTNKAVTPTVYIMQRLHQNDPSGHILAKQKENVKHICIPGEIRNFRKLVQPQELINYYVDDLMDVHRLTWSVLRDLEMDLGQYGYSGQIGQEPTPPGGGMFKTNQFGILLTAPDVSRIVHCVRYWDKAGTEGGKGAYTCGVKMAKLTNGSYLVLDVRRGRWGSDEREKIIRNTAELDGISCEIWVEQEPGSGGKESAESTIKNLAGYTCRAERPMGDKIYRADPYSVQVNVGNVSILHGGWNSEFIEEHRFFPYSTYKDQVDASAGAFSRLTSKKIVRRVI